jgi:hypothetical protein
MNVQEDHMGVISIMLRGISHPELCLINLLATGKDIIKKVMVVEGSDTEVMATKDTTYSTTIATGTINLITGTNITGNYN